MRNSVDKKRVKVQTKRIVRQLFRTRRIGQYSFDLFLCFSLLSLLSFLFLSPDFSLAKEMGINFDCHTINVRKNLLFICVWERLIRWRLESRHKKLPFSVRFSSFFMPRSLALFTHSDIFGASQITAAVFAYRSCFSAVPRLLLHFWQIRIYSRRLALCRWRRHTKQEKIRFFRSMKNYFCKFVKRAMRLLTQFHFRLFLCLNINIRNRYFFAAFCCVPFSSDIHLICSRQNSIKVESNELGIHSNRIGNEHKKCQFDLITANDANQFCFVRFFLLDNFRTCFIWFV